MVITYVKQQLQLVIVTAEIADLLFSSSPSSYTTPTMPFILYEDAHKIPP
jgi:hypothetical protein